MQLPGPRTIADASNTLAGIMIIGPLLAVVLVSGSLGSIP